MAIPIPRAEETVTVRAPNISAPQVGRQAPLAAFGGETAEATAKLGDAVNRLGGALATRLIERQQVEEEKQVMAAHNDFSRDLQNSLLDPEADADGRPKGVLNRRLDQAKDSTKDLDTQYGQLRESYLERVPQGRQKEALAARMDRDYDQARAGVIRHEVSQGHDAFKMQFSTTLERDPALAQKILDGNKSKLPETMTAALQSEVDGKMLATERAGLWDSMTGGNAFRMADGNWDLGAMQETVMALEKPQDHKEKLWDYIRARADEDRVIRARAADAADRGFANEVLAAQKRGAGLDEALKLTGRFSSDAYDQAQKTEVVKKLYAPPTNSDPRAYINLWESIQDGGATKKEIDGALNVGHINAKDWEQLRKDFYRQQTEGSSPADQLEWKRIQDLVKRKYTNETDQQDALYVIQSLARKPEERQRILDELEKKVPDTGTFYDDTRLAVSVKALDERRARGGAQREAVNKAAADLSDPKSDASRVRDWLRANHKDTGLDTILKVLSLDPKGMEWGGQAKPAARAGGAGTAKPTDYAGIVDRSTLP